MNDVINMKRPNNPNLTVKVKPETAEERKLLDIGNCDHENLKKINPNSPNAGPDLKCEFNIDTTDPTADKDGYHSAYRIKQPFPYGTKKSSKNKNPVESAETEDSLKSPEIKKTIESKTSAEMEETEYSYGVKRKRSQESMEIEEFNNSITKRKKMEGSTEGNTSEEFDKSNKVDKPIEVKKATEIGIDPRRCKDCNAVTCGDCLRNTPAPSTGESGSESENEFIADVIRGNFTPSPTKNVSMNLDTALMEDFITENNNSDNDNSDNNNLDFSKNKPNSSDNSNSGSGPNVGSNSGSGSDSGSNSGSGSDSSNNPNSNNNSGPDNNSEPDNNSGPNNNSASSNSTDNNNNNQSNFYNSENSNENSNKKCTFIEYFFILFFQIVSILSDCIDIFF